MDLIVPELYFLVTLLFVFFSMVFSSTEASFFSLSRFELITMKSFYLPKKYWPLILNPEELLIVLITGNEIVDYFASFFFSEGFRKLFPYLGQEIPFLIMAVVSFFAGEFFPKLIGFKYNYRVFPKTIKIVYLFYFIFSPFRKLFNFFYQKLEKIFSIGTPRTEDTFSPVEQIILASLELAYKEKKISEQEKKFIFGLFLSEKIPVSAIMIPRSEVILLKDKVITVEDLERIKSYGYNQFPVYKDNPDHIKGIFHVKYFIKNFSPGIFKKQLTFLDFSIKPYFVNENIKVRDLLFEFQKRHVKVAIVVDEYGIFKGLVTLEDILEELFGEFYDEREQKIVPIKKIGKNRWLVSGKALVDEVFSIVGLTVKEESLKNVKTVNGFLITLFKEVPEPGKEIVYENIKFKVLKVKKRRIEWVEIEKLDVHEEK